MIVIIKAQCVCEGCGKIVDLNLEQRVARKPPADWEHFQARDARPPHDYCPACKDKRARQVPLPNDARNRS